ncbi:mercury resistance system transport protein MerF [Fodinicurvata sp. EGI_FJ10296]|uniref:mercury resistance system transport protein MerF n=1 Tax=Fodinicurvata sp. EGI_FJ10296 TaxID=3231908 RepID=UPI003451B491
MKDATIIKTGAIGTVIAAICCFTPVLVILFGIAGLAAWLGWLDYVLLPALAVFAGIAVFGLWRRQRVAACCETDTKATKENT